MVTDKRSYSAPVSFAFIALQHMWRLKFCNPNQLTNGIGGATCLSVFIGKKSRAPF